MKYGFIIIILFSNLLLAAEVIMIQRDFPQKNNVQEVPIDVYINDSFSAGDMVAIVRNLVVKTPDNIQKFSGLQVPFCIVKIIHSDKGLSIGRVVFIRNRNELPNIEHFSPIIGDIAIKADKTLLEEYNKKGNVSFKPQETIIPNQDPTQKDSVETNHVIL